MQLKEKCHLYLMPAACVYKDPSLHKNMHRCLWGQCKRHCYTVLYNMCTLLLSTGFTHVVHFNITTLRIGTLYTGVYKFNNECITPSITEV